MESPRLPIPVHSDFECALSFFQHTPSVTNSEHQSRLGYQDSASLFISLVDHPIVLRINEPRYRWLDRFERFHEHLFGKIEIVRIAEKAKCGLRVVGCVGEELEMFFLFLQKDRFLNSKSMQEQNHLII
jgi:hypothetical protein